MSPTGVWLALALVAASFQPAPALPRSARDDEKPLCECVPYYQCDENNVIKTDGAELIDVRFQACGDPFEVCCEIPKEADGGKVTQAPHEVTQAPYEVTQSPHEVTQAPHEETQAPHEETQAPHEETQCECVAFYECDDKNIYKASTLLDARTRSCEHDQVCCMKPSEPEKEEEPEEHKPACVCTPFFLCDENDYIVEDGAGALDSRVSCPGDTEICCYPKKSTEKPPVDGLHDTSDEDSSDENSSSDEDSSEEAAYTHVPSPKPSKQSGCGHVTTCEEVEFGEAYKVQGPEGSPVPTGFGEFPWMVAIFRGEDLICGGSLIHPKVVLTAAHCTLKNPEKGDLKVRAGEWDLERKAEPIKHQERPVKHVIKHELFKPASLHNDVSLLILNKKIKINDAVNIVCYKNTNHTYGTDCIATGWGQTKFEKKGALQSILKQVNLPIVESHECQERLRKARLGKYFKLHEGFLCAGGIPEHDTCTGDGGGPLVCPQQDGSYTQVGIVAWGIGCGNDVPAVYASVHHYSDWIENHLRHL